MKRLEFDAYLSADQPDPIRVTVCLADQLVAEREAPRHGIPAQASAPLHMAALWVWCALRRTGHGVGEFREWVAAGGDFDPVKDEADDVDPTPATASTTSC